jgi:hypothetical protein
MLASYILSRTLVPTLAMYLLKAPDKNAVRSGNPFTRAQKAGIIIFLFLTHTTLSVPPLMGAIMCMGVGTANSILVVAFAAERLSARGKPVEAAIEAGFTRFRPVLMTALAMIIGMIPMALGLGDGGEQNAPLGRAVIGGLLCATVATLLFVPTVFGLLHGMRLSRGNSPSTEDAHARAPDKRYGSPRSPSTSAPNPPRIFRSLPDRPDLRDDAAVPWPRAVIQRAHRAVRSLLRAVRRLDKVLEDSQ